MSALRICWWTKEVCSASNISSIILEVLNEKKCSNSWSATPQSLLLSVNEAVSQICTDCNTTRMLFIKEKWLFSAFNHVITLFFHKKYWISHAPQTGLLQHKNSLMYNSYWKSGRKMSGLRSTAVSDQSWGNLPMNRLLIHLTTATSTLIYTKYFLKIKIHIELL